MIMFKYPVKKKHKKQTVLFLHKSDCYFILMQISDHCDSDTAVTVKLRKLKKSLTFTVMNLNFC